MAALPPADEYSDYKKLKSVGFADAVEVKEFVADPVGAAAALRAAAPGGRARAVFQRETTGAG